MIKDEIASMYPASVLPGFVQDYNVSMLYRLQPPDLLDDVLILAFCECLMQTHATVRATKLLPAKAVGARGAKDMTVPDDIAASVASTVGETETTTIVIPVNFGNHHWCGVIADVSRKTVRYYDSMNDRRYQIALDALTWNLARDVLVNWQVVSSNAPIQFDSHSCGVFVCFKFWSHADRTIAKDMSSHGLLARRFELLRFVYDICTSTSL